MSTKKLYLNKFFIYSELKILSKKINIWAKIAL